MRQVVLTLVVLSLASPAAAQFGALDRAQKGLKKLEQARDEIVAMVRGLVSLGVPPNILTTVGVSINVFCGVLFGMGEFFWAGIVLIVANVFDMLDGNVARTTGNVTRYGGFLDSSLDRLSDMVAILGIMVFYASNTPQHSLLNVILGGVSMIAAAWVSKA